ncbi:MAG: acyltransferase family protein [Acidobacteria bacterium]|nr:acyltransferase family protein [Acidobacteriota bacterium]
MSESSLVEDVKQVEPAGASTTNVVEFAPAPAAAPEPAGTEAPKHAPKRAPSHPRRPRRVSRPAPPRATGRTVGSEGKVIAVKFLDHREDQPRRESAPASSSGASAGSRPASLLASLLDPERLKRTYLELRMWNRSLEVDEFGFDRKYTESLMPVFEFLYEKWWRVELGGVEHIPSSGRALIVANHSGVLPWDGAMMRVGLEREHPARRTVRLLALDMFALLPFLAPMLARTGMVRACQENGERLLNQDELVGVFPEGVKGVGKYFKDRYKLARFGRGGFIRLALKTGSPIIPCAVTGSEEIHPVIAKADWIGKPLGLPYFPITPTFPLLGLLGVVPLPTKWFIDFGEPITFGDHALDQLDNPLQVNRMAQEVRAVIQNMLNARLQRRRSVWVG